VTAERVKCFAVPEETSALTSSKQLKPCLLRPKMTGKVGEIVGTVTILSEDDAGYDPYRPIAKSLACRDTQYIKDKSTIPDEVFIFS
jgi:hypothetical protein